MDQNVVIIRPEPSNSMCSPRTVSGYSQLTECNALKIKSDKDTDIIIEQLEPWIFPDMTVRHRAAIVYSCFVDTIYKCLEHRNMYVVNRCDWMQLLPCGLDTKQDIFMWGLEHVNVFGVPSQLIKDHYQLWRYEKDIDWHGYTIAMMRLYKFGDIQSKLIDIKDTYGSVTNYLDRLNY